MQRGNERFSVLALGLRGELDLIRSEVIKSFVRNKKKKTEDVLSEGGNAERCSENLYEGEVCTAGRARNRVL